MSPDLAANERHVFGYLADRQRRQQGCWISVSDIRGALGLDRERVEDACRRLGESGLAELMGGFPLRPTNDRFTLVRLTARGASLAESPKLVAERFGTDD